MVSWWINRRLINHVDLEWIINGLPMDVVVL
jgi:hypothetical protein